jgi:hypothetical protein
MAYFFWPKSYYFCLIFAQKWLIMKGYIAYFLPNKSVKNSVSIPENE